MTDYVKSTNFASKDALASGNALKIVKGTEIDTEFNNIAIAVATKADLASPALTGTPTAPTAAGGTNTTQIATTAFVALKADLASPAFTGTPTAPTAAPGTNTTQVATTAFVQGEKASPAFTGTPTAPTAAADTNTTQLATTAMVVGQAASATPLITGSAAVGSSLRYARQDHSHANPTAIFSRSFTSSEQTLTSAGALTIAHGLGVSPLLVVAYLVCKSAEFGYSIGNQLFIDAGTDDTYSLGHGMAIKRDATNILVKFGSDPNIFAIIDFGNGNRSNATNGSWKLVLSVYA